MWLCGCGIEVEINWHARIVFQCGNGLRLCSFSVNFSFWSSTIAVSSSVVHCSCIFLDLLLIVVEIKFTCTGPLSLSKGDWEWMDWTSQCEHLKLRQNSKWVCCLSPICVIQTVIFVLGFMYKLYINGRDEVCLMKLAWLSEIKWVNVRVSEETIDSESVCNINKPEWGRVDAIDVMKVSVQRRLQNATCFVFHLIRFLFVSGKFCLWIPSR